MTCTLESVHAISFWHQTFGTEYTKILAWPPLQILAVKKYFSRKGFFREIPTGLLQHVLTVLVFWSWVLLLPQLPHWSRSLRLFPWTSILLYGPLDIAWICSPQLPHHPCKNGDTQHMFLQHKGAHADFCRNPRGIFPNKFLGEFCRGFFGGFFRAFFLGKIHPKIHGNFQIKIWEFRGQNPHCKDPGLNASIFATLGGETLLEKCRWNIFKRPERGLKLFGHGLKIVWSHSGSFFGSFFIQTVFHVGCKTVRGQFRSAGVPP